MKMLTNMGGVWKVSDLNYARLLCDAANGKDWDLDDYGKFLGDIINVTDMGADEAQERIEKEGRRMPISKMKE